MRTKGYKPADPEAIELARALVKHEYKLDTLPPAHHPRVLDLLRDTNVANLRYRHRMMTAERP